MKAFAIAILALLGLLAVVSRFVPVLLMSVSVFWLGLASATVVILVYRSVNK